MIRRWCAFYLDLSKNIFLETVCSDEAAFFLRIDSYLKIFVPNFATHPKVFRFPWFGGSILLCWWGLWAGARIVFHPNHRAKTKRESMVTNGVLSFPGTHQRKSGIFQIKSSIVVYTTIKRIVRMSYIVHKFSIVAMTSLSSRFDGHGPLISSRKKAMVNFLYDQPVHPLRVSIKRPLGGGWEPCTHPIPTDRQSHFLYKNRNRILKATTNHTHSASTYLVCNHTIEADCQLVLSLLCSNVTMGWYPRNKWSHDTPQFCGYRSGYGTDGH